MSVTELHEELMKIARTQIDTNPAGKYLKEQMPLQMDRVIADVIAHITMYVHLELLPRVK